MRILKWQGGGGKIRIYPHRVSFYEFRGGCRSNPRVIENGLQNVACSKRKKDAAVRNNAKEGRRRFEVESIRASRYLGHSVSQPMNSEPISFGIQALGPLILIFFSKNHRFKCSAATLPCFQSKAQCLIVDVRTK